MKRFIQSTLLLLAILLPVAITAQPCVWFPNGCNAIIETATNTLIASCQNTVIPGTVTAIGANAFGDIENLNHIDIADVTVLLDALL